jgi:long-chain acyl-CoA synthetase
VPLLQDRPGQPMRDDVDTDGAHLIAAAEAPTLWALFRARVQHTPEAVACRAYDGDRKGWTDHSWAAVAARVERLRAALAGAGLRPGDRVAVLLPNGPDWVCLDLAAQGSGLVVVGLYPQDTAASNAVMLGDCDARLLLTDSAARWQALSPLRAEFPALERVWIRESPTSQTAAIAGLAVHGLDEVLADAPVPPAPHDASPGDVASLIYTSGGGGRPKGVMLSHHALLWNARAAAAVIPPRPDDVFLSVLPLAHAFERTIGYYLPMLGGCTVAYARSARDLADDLAALRPTVMLGVPLLFARVAAAVRARAAGNIVKRQLLGLAATVGWRRFLARQRRRRGGPALLLWPLLDRLVARPVRAALGGRLRVAVSGGAPLDAGVARLLIGLGLPLIEGYGLTEAAPVVAANRLDDNWPGSVGRPLQGIVLKLGAQDELMVRTPSVMSGYWKDSARTRQVVDPDGWLATGDIAELKDGRVFLRGRLADMVVLSIGEKVKPEAVETALTADPLFRQALVVGDRRPFPVAVIVLDEAAWRLFAAGRGLDPRAPNHPASRSELQARIAPLLAALPRYAQVRALHLTLAPWTVEAGLLTPTLKLKRERIAPLFAQAIDALYAAAEAAPQADPRGNG